MHIDYEKLNRAYILASDEIWLEDDGFVTKGKIRADKRIGLDSPTIPEQDKYALKRFILEI